MKHPLLQLIRPRHWVKNAFVFAAALFSLQLGQLAVWGVTLLAFAAFSMAASCIYVVNDLMDLKQDQLHPVKRFRPLARGSVSPRQALVVAGVCLVAAFLLTGLINQVPLEQVTAPAGHRLSLTPAGGVAVIIALYLVMNLAYSWRLKHVAILDVMIIATGFVMRVIAGALAVNIVVSSWILLTTFSISLFLGFAKRKNEGITLEETARSHRPVLDAYPPQLLDGMMHISATLTIIAYALYTIDPEVVARLGTHRLIYTVPLVIYGLFRYMHLVYHCHDGGDPAELVTRDKPILAVVVLWAGTVLLLIY